MPVLSVRDLSIDCDFRRVDGFLFTAPDMKRDDAKKRADTEFEAALKVGAGVERCHGVPLAGFRPVYTSRYYAIYANC